MTAREHLRRIGSRELKTRVGPNLIRGLIASVFVHSAVISIGFFDMGSQPVLEQEVPGTDTSTTYDGTIIILPPLPRTGPKPPPRPDDPMLEEIPVPVPHEPEEPEEIKPEPIDDNPPDFRGTVGESADSTGDEPGDGSAATNDSDGDLTTIAGIEPPWSKHTYREIEPKPLDFNPRPEYPDMAKLSGISAKVYVWVKIGVDGKVKAWNVVHVTVPGLGFEEAVARVIPRWEFTPAIQGQRPVEVWMNVPFVFEIKH
jgi:TonB family protein